jgi:ribosomal protein S18 acetylase RimI-like enzyme
MGAESNPVPAGYRLFDGTPSLEDYLHVREASGLSPRRPDQGELALRGSWAAVYAVHEESSATVGMGRVLGDGGWYFHIADMAVLPEHQSRGLGDAILSRLLAVISALAPAGAYVNLLADPPGRGLYERHGFRESAPESIGMARVLPGGTS